jgi:solute:Na+ symporter, SSS family
VRRNIPLQLSFIDWAIVAAFFIVTLAIGAIVSKQAGKSSADFFLSGRNMPWWLLGFSMVATTFAADTPLFVTNIVRNKGVASNWMWWSFLLTGMLTVFIYAKLWRRSGVVTDLEYYELRYSGKPAAFLRGFRAIYLGVIFNVVIMANVTLAAIKIGEIMFGFEPWQTISIAATVSVIFSAMGGLKGVLITDCILFVVAMVGSFGAAYYSVNNDQVGGLTALFAHEKVAEKLALIPEFSLSSHDKIDLLFGVFLIPILIQWWASWYPGAEPGGGGYIAQRMLAAKNEKHATGATLFFNIAHYALRPWPWIIVALASIVIYPDLDSIKAAFPDATPGLIKGDSAYPAMLTFLPTGFKGIVVASLIAAYMSTISTHLNWGSSYVVNDVWKRFYRPEASEKELVWVGRYSTVILMVAACALAAPIQSAAKGFQLLLQIGAGTGLLFILRWYWWRINPFSEIVAMIVSFTAAVGLHFFGDNVRDTLIPIFNQIGLPIEIAIDPATGEKAGLPAWISLSIGVSITTLSWIVATLLTPPDTNEKLFSFLKKIRPGGPGWKKIIDKAEAQGIDLGNPKTSGVGIGITCMIAGCIAVYAALFATGSFLYGEQTRGFILTAVAVAGFIVIALLWNKVHADVADEQPAETE